MQEANHDIPALDVDQAWSDADLGGKITLTKGLTENSLHRVRRALNRAKKEQQERMKILGDLPSAQHARGMVEALTFALGVLKTAKEHTK